jgi:hypothetical protein
MRYIALFCLGLLVAHTGRAARVTPVVAGGQLGVVVSVVEYPDSLQKDLVSGLTNELLLDVKLLAGTRELGRRTASLSIRYDLWEEKFTSTLKIDEAPPDVRTNVTRKDIDESLAAIRLSKLFPVNGLANDERLVVQVQMLLNPIERERIEAIKRWVARHSTYTPTDTPGYSDKTVASARSNGIFNGIFQQYAGGAKSVASWTMSVSTQPFKLDEVRDEP